MGRGFRLILFKERREKNCGEIMVEDWRYTSRENLVNGRFGHNYVISNCGAVFGQIG